MYAMEVLQWAQLNSSGCHDFPKATKKGPLIRKKRYCQQMHLGWQLQKLLIDLSVIALCHYCSHTYTAPSLFPPTGSKKAPSVDWIHLHWTLSQKCPPKINTNSFHFTAFQKSYFRTTLNTALKCLLGEWRRMFPMSPIPSLDSVIWSALL